jgi:peptide/nickel transport system permease protein
MIKENYGYIILPESAYLALLPGIAILLLSLAFTFVANGLRDAMDSRQQLLR